MCAINQCQNVHKHACVTTVNGEQERGKERRDSNDRRKNVIGFTLLRRETHGLKTSAYVCRMAASLETGILYA